MSRPYHFFKLESQSSQISIHHYKVNHILAEQKLENIDARVSWLVMILRLNYYVNSEWGSIHNYVKNKRWVSGPKMFISVNFLGEKYVDETMR